MILEKPPKEDLERMELDGMTKTDIANHYNVSRGTISRWRIYYGLVRTFEKRPSKEQIEACIDEGMMTKEIAIKYGICASTVSMLMTAFEIKCARTRAQEARHKKVIEAIKTPATLSDISKATGIEIGALSSYLDRLKQKGEAAIVGECGLWGIPEEAEEVKPVSTNIFMAAVNAPQFVGMIEHQQQVRI